MARVLILKGDSYLEVASMFISRGYDVVIDNGEHPKGVDIICFTGGSDVSPYIYGEEPDGAVGCDPVRDEYERELFDLYFDKPKVGICRGGQLLNVLSGGRMMQDIGLISGDIFDDEGRELRVDHHQGMLSHHTAELHSWAPVGDGEEDPDYAAWYGNTKSLCFQPHPEWDHKETEEFFFELIDAHIGV